MCLITKARHEPFQRHTPDAIDHSIAAHRRYDPTDLDRRQLFAGPGPAAVLYRRPAAVLQHLPEDVVQVARDGRERVFRAAEHLELGIRIRVRDRVSVDETVESTNQTTRERENARSVQNNWHISQ